MGSTADNLFFVAVDARAPVSVADIPPERVPWRGSAERGWRTAVDDLGMEVARTHLGPTVDGVVSYVITIENRGASATTLSDIRPLDLRLSLSATDRPSVRHLSGSWHYDGCFPPRAFRIAEETFMTDDHSKSVIIGGANAALHSPLIQVAVRQDGRLSGMFAGFEWSAGWELSAGWTTSSFRGEPCSPFRVAGTMSIGPLTLAPGERIELPPVHLGFFDVAGWAEADDFVRQFVLARAPEPTALRPRRPVAYNSWFGTAETFDLTYLLDQAEAAADIGCEYFCLDAGWYRGQPTFLDGIGNWDTPHSDKFGSDGRGLQMLRDKVRNLGMRFGIWLVPQAAQPGTDIVRARPDLYRDTDATNTRAEYERRYGSLNEGFPGLGEGLRLALERQEAADYLFDVFRRIIKRWDVEWIRVESVPEDGLAYNRCYDGVLDRVREEFPHVFLEACNGGGQRLDLGAVVRSDGNWLSDHTSDAHVVRFMQAGALRFWPAAFLNMAVVSQRREPLPPTQLDLLSRMVGSLSFSGHIAAWDDDARRLAARHVALFKAIRDLEGPVRFPLLQPRSIRDWEAVHVTSAGGGELLYVFRVCGPDEQRLDVAAAGWELASGSVGASLTADGTGTRVTLPADGAGLWVRGGVRLPEGDGTS